MTEPIRVRPHVAAAVAEARHVLLDFDGVCFDVPDTGARQAVEAMLAARPYRPRPLAMWGGDLPRLLVHLDVHEPDNAGDAEAAVTAAEFDAALTAPMAAGLRELLAACAAAGRRVGVFGEIAEAAMLATLRAYDLELPVAGRQGLDVDTFDGVPNAERAARTFAGRCLIVSGSWPTLHAGTKAGMAALGVTCGRDTRKHLASDGPVVSNLTQVRHALTR